MWGENPLRTIYKCVINDAISVKKKHACISVWSLHALPMLPRVLPLSKYMHVSVVVIGDSKLPKGSEFKGDSTC